MHIAAKQVFSNVLRPPALAHQLRQLHKPAAGSHEEGKHRVCHRFVKHSGGVAQHDAARLQHVQRVVVHAHRNAGHHLQPGRTRQHGGIDGKAGADEPVRLRQRRIKPRALVGLARVGHRHVVHGGQTRQLVGRQLAKHQHLLARWACGVVC